MDNKPFWLPPVEPQAQPPLDIRMGAPVDPFLITPLHAKVLATKNDIDRITPDGKWDDAKKITNTYEYIFLSLQRRMYQSISAITPLSRSYFKMIEMWDTLGLTGIQRTAHTAEGPGGFLEAIQDRTGNTTPMTAMTLRSTERTIPGWRKSQAFLTRYPMVRVTYGADDTGNLYRLVNQDAFTALATQDGPVDLYTADGGFDFSADFNGQENTVQRLLVAEALAGLTTLRIGGTMIIKIFDTKHRATLEFLWTLASCFERTGLVKPYTSRPANSERYWIGIGYRGAPAWILSLFRTLTAQEAPLGWSQLFATPPTAAWIAPLQQYQEAIEAQQLHKIQLTLNIIKSPTREQIQGLLQENIRNSRVWCMEHGIPLNPRYAALTEDQIVAANLEEALGPFQGAVARTCLPGLFRQQSTPHGSTGTPIPPPPVVSAWRSALPRSVLGREPFQRDGGTAVSRSLTPPQSDSV
jgi:23S rRNA U2552 (ribose-2'-O)-methylase RlmE/FtsJ